MSAHPHPRPLSHWRGRGEEPRANLEPFSLSRLRERVGVRVVE
jgi:hypothetical protein